MSDFNPTLAASLAQTLEEADRSATAGEWHVTEGDGNIYSKPDEVSRPVDVGACDWSDPDIYATTTLRNHAHRYQRDRPHRRAEEGRGAMNCRHAVSMDSIKHRCDVVPDAHRGPSATGRGCLAWKTCAKCGAWLPLGPSNDTGCEVEIRAAELAGHMSWFLGGPGAPVGTIDKSELRGCGQHRNNGTPTNDYEHAGYLARCIADHDSATEREGRR